MSILIPKILEKKSIFCEEGAQERNFVNDSWTTSKLGKWLTSCGRRGWLALALPSVEVGGRHRLNEERYLGALL